MPLLLRLVVVACLLINCVDCEFAGNNITTNTVSDYETAWTTLLSAENYTKDYITPSAEIIHEASTEITTTENSKCENCGIDGLSSTIEKENRNTASSEHFEEISTLSYSAEIIHEASTEITTTENSKCENCGIDGLSSTTEKENRNTASSEHFEEISTLSYSSENEDHTKTIGTTPTIDNLSTEEVGEISISMENEIFTTTENSILYVTTTEKQNMKTIDILDSREATSSTTTSSPDSREINNVCSECIHTNPKISNFKADRISARKVLLSWDPLKETISNCEYQYTINSTSNGSFIPFFRHQRSNAYLYENLRLCEKYDLVIEANNMCDLKDVIYKTIYTDPEKVVDFSINIYKDFTTIIWSGAKSPHCSKYRVYINGESFDTDSNVFTRNTTLYCANVGVQTIRSDNKTGELTFRIAKPGEVNNFQITNNEEGQLRAIWEPPNDSSCVSQYKVKLEKPNTNTAPVFHTISETSYIFENLESCSTYTISVAAICNDDLEGDYKEKSANTIEPKIIKKVQDAKHVHENGNEFLTWTPPALQEKCIEYYELSISEEHFKTNKTVFEHKGIGCKTYTTGIIATSKLGIKSESENFKEYTIPAILPKAPSIESNKEADKTKATFNIKPESSGENACKLVRVQVTCLAVNNTQPWMIQYKIQNKIIETEDDESVTVDGLSEYTDYSCKAQVENDAGWSPTSTSIDIKTKEEVPTEPLSFTYTNINPTVFELKWAPPYKIPGKLRGYKLVIEPIKSLHFETELCKENPEGSQKPPIMLPADETTYTFNDALPNYRYNCYITAETIGDGKPATLELDTLSGIPDPPSEVTVTTDIIQGSSYNGSATLQWHHPCKTRGIVKYFQVTLTGESTEKLKSVQTQFVPPHDNLEYSYIFSLLPLYEYEAKIITILINGISSQEVSTRRFESPDGYPSPPTAIVATSLTEESFNISWKPPVNKNGKLTQYTVAVSALGPIHDVPTECDIDSKKYSHYVPAEETCYIFKNSRPYYKYDIIITANTKTTVGFSSTPLLHGTPKSTSESVRNLNYSVNYDQTEEYNSSVLITFTKPCNLNGPLIYYEISLVGTLNNEPKEQVARTLDYEWTFMLKPVFEYKVSVAVVTDCSPYCKSAAVTENFAAPSGVPPVIENGLKPDLQNIQENAVTVTLNKDLFGDDVGEIMYYAILLTGSEVYNSSKTSYGFWDSEEWPDLGTWRNDTTYVETYQATPIKWNPFEKRNADAAEFTVGIENCSDSDTYCNGPLRPDTKYYMEIMAFTKNAYRNYEAISFSTPQIEDLDTASNVVKIIGIVVGVLAFVMLCGIAVFIWRRKRPKPIDDDVIIDSHDVQYRPIRLKKFPNLYKEIKETDQVLNTEFMFLNSLSANVELPITEALLSENRKKNRYINVLPYDDIRVVLDDDMSSYINASYIKGFSNTTEYIATQGPLPETSLDFWKMILQENVTVIVMVAHFIEQEKKKCYKYVPDDADPIDIGDDIRIRCAAKLDFKSHCERHVKIQTKDRKHEVTHLQFLNWPDFGCPTGTENMLNFCRIMRSHVKEDPGIIVVHCSAGVGRTGTLIAVDILLQTMSNGLDIDVFNTVLNLRKQRRSMVQTQAQYEYIYTCLYDAITDPPPSEEIKAYEPVYENLKNGMEMKVFKSDNNENIEANI